MIFNSIKKKTIYLSFTNLIQIQPGLTLGKGRG